MTAPQNSFLTQDPGPPVQQGCAPCESSGEGHWLQQDMELGAAVLKGLDSVWVILLAPLLQKVHKADVRSDEF